MTEIDSRLEEYHSLDPKRFSILERFEVRQSHPPADQPEISLQIELSSPIEDEERRLLLSFFGVREFRLKQEASSLLQMTLITIESIGRDGWEGLNYRAREEEEDSLFLYCRDFSPSLEGGY
jgi:hypothetical protein